MVFLTRCKFTGKRTVKNASIKYQYETLPAAFRLSMQQITLPRKQILSIGMIKLVCELDSVPITGNIILLKTDTNLAL